MSTTKILSNDTASVHSQVDTQGTAEPDTSVVSRVLKVDMNVLEGLIHSYDLIEGRTTSSSSKSSDKTSFDKAWDKGPWDEGHWANRK